MEQEKRHIKHAFCAHCDAHIKEALGCLIELNEPLEFLICPYCYEINLIVDDQLQTVDEQQIFDLDRQLLLALRLLQQKAREENRTDASYLMKPSNCPTCQHTLTGARTVTGAKPQVGDFAVCCSCSALNRFDDDFDLVSTTEQTVLDAIEDQEEAQQFLSHLKQQQERVRKQNQIITELEHALGELFQQVFGRIKS